MDGLIPIYLLCGSNSSLRTFPHLVQFFYCRTVELIELARENDVHLLCLPAHCTHLLQPLDVGLFKPFKSYFSKACSNYLAKNPGQVVTPEKLSSLIAEAWPCTFTPVNTMSGFKKAGIGEVTNRQLGPSKVFHQPQPNNENTSAKTGPILSSSGSPLFFEEKEALFRKRYAENYDLGDPEYVAWLKIAHPEVNVSVTISDTDSSSSMTCGASSATSSSKTGSAVSETTDLSGILVVPRKKKAALTAKAVCITSTEVLEELKIKEAEVEQQKVIKQQEQEKKLEKKGKR